jgi:hypothetical protein
MEMLVHPPYASELGPHKAKDDDGSYYSGNKTCSMRPDHSSARGGVSAAARRHHPFNELACGSKPASNVS